MEDCKHEILRLLPVKNNRLRCRHCHLSITEEELGNDCCPECLSAYKIRRRDFEKSKVQTMEPFAIAVRNAAWL